MLIELKGQMTGAPETETGKVLQVEGWAQRDGVSSARGVGTSCPQAGSPPGATGPEAGKIKVD
jgi:hypothetical protein